MTTKINVKSGKGLSDGVISELATYWNVLPGHEGELRAATQRFADVLRQIPPDKNIHTGLRDSRHVIFDNGQRLMWATTFENDWDPYFDDFVQIGVEHFLDWLQHTAQYTDVSAWVESSGGVEKFRLDNPDIEAQMKRTVGGLKAIVQSVQSPATGYFNQLSAWTMPQIVKAQRLQEAFQQVLDDSRAAEALQHPALEPLLEMAAD
ncbi:hypothetical protein OHB56_18220 [Streptomyces sp. NBC_01635]|uniref:hypothetical protein n=1 Tax=Streptomyces sp. NBC_01635 TaxID=2975904 RepID=UPI00386B1AFC|nr:hypothetical protein OHB56_18220 [Streptomyces sp. NBC_01635]